MSNILVSGPAGGGKSAVAREELAAQAGPAVVADFQSVVVAMLQLERLADGRFPVRPPWILPITEYVRRSIITGATNRDIAIIATNSDGASERRRFLLGQLGPGAIEKIVDPGRATVEARLADAATGDLSPQCGEAVNRWYSRLS